MSKNKSKKSRAALPVDDGAIQFSKAKPLAARIGLHPKTLFRWADAGLIHRHKVNDRVVLFEIAEVFSIITAARVAGNSPRGRAA